MCGPPQLYKYAKIIKEIEALHSSGLITVPVPPLIINFFFQVLPPKEVDEEIAISGIDLSSTSNIVRVSTERGQVNGFANINIIVLHDALGLTGTPMPSQIVDYLPAVGNAMFVGDTITELVIYHHAQMAADFDTFMQEEVNSMNS